MSKANLSKSDESTQERVEITLASSDAKSELDALSSIVERVASKQASSAIDYLVASCAICFDELQSMQTRNYIMSLTNERATFVALKSNVSSDAEASFDMQDTVHRAYCTRYAVRKAKNNDALLDARVRRSLKKHVSTAREQADYSYTLLSIMLSKSASKLIASKRDEIVEAYANSSFKRAYKKAQKA